MFQIHISFWKEKHLLIDLFCFFRHVPKTNGCPVVANTLVWSHHGQNVRGVCDWSRYDVDDVGLLQHRDHLHGHFNMLHDPVKVRLKELLAKAYRNQTARFNPKFSLVCQLFLLQQADLEVLHL